MHWIQVLDLIVGFIFMVVMYGIIALWIINTGNKKK